jgi:hypothetical protein
MAENHDDRGDDRNDGVHAFYSSGFRGLSSGFNPDVIWLGIPSGCGLFLSLFRRLSFDDSHAT